MEERKGSPTLAPLSESTSPFFSVSSSSAPPVPSVPPPVSPVLPLGSGILSTSRQRQWTSSSQNMAAKVETTVREWSTPVQKVVEGEPPKPEDHPTTIHGEASRSNIRTVTPSYKYPSEKPGYEMNLSSSTNLPEAVGDYKVKETQDHFKLQIIDPKVTSNANMPATSTNLPGNYRRTLDFPSEHSKRSFLKLEPLEPRRIRSVETRPITTSAYLTESLDRHRDMEASRLREYLKAKESEANKPWHKPDWPGPKERETDQSLKELEEIRKTIETLQKAAAEGPKKNTDLDELARLNEKLLERSKGRRTDYKLVDSEIVKTAPEPVPPSIKEHVREMLESRVSNDTSVNSTLPQQDRSGYVTDVSSATWQFSTHSFSPRSVVSINGGSKADDGLLRVRTDLSPGLTRTLSRSNAAVQTAHLESEKQHWPYMPANLGSVADSAQSTMTREYNESYSRRIDRYASLPTLDANRGTLIKIKDDKPRGIMKRRELETKDQMMYANEPRQIAKQNHWEQKEVIQSKPRVTETVQKFEERTRTEEIERRVQRKEKKEKKHKSAHRSYQRSGEREMIGYPEGESGGEHRERQIEIRREQTAEGKHHREHSEQRELALRESGTEARISRSATRRSRASSIGGVQKIYERRAFSPRELNEAVRNAYMAVERAHRDIRNYRSQSLTRHNGYLPSQESYTRTTTTRREREGRYLDDGRYQMTNGGVYTNGNRYGTLSDSLRRGEMKYNPNGEVREVHTSRNGRVHKSYSTRDVFDSGNFDDFRTSSSYRRGSQQTGPYIEFPPTLPRMGGDRDAPVPPPHRGRSASTDFYRPVTKSRSYADWDDGRGFGRDEDMMRLENEFRDSLLMPLPRNGGNMYEKDHRHEQIPGGYETYDREMKATSGRRLNRDGNPTQFSEASQEYSYKREMESDRRR